MSAPDSTDDAALWARWRDGDKRAGEILFERHFDAVYRFFDRKVRRGEAGIDVADLVQRTFLGCVEAKDRFAGLASFRTYLFAIARNELYGHFRARKKGAVVDFGVSSLAELSPSPSTLARQRDARGVLLECLGALPLDLQLTLELRFWEDQSGPELAAILEVPEGTVRSRLRRALAELREAVVAHENESTVAAALLPRGEEDLEVWAARLRAQVELDEA